MPVVNTFKTTELLRHN